MDEHRHKALENVNCYFSSCIKGYEGQTTTACSQSFSFLQSWSSTNRLPMTEDEFQEIAADPKNKAFPSIILTSHYRIFTTCFSGEGGIAALPR